MPKLSTQRRSSTVLVWGAKFHFCFFHHHFLRIGWMLEFPNIFSCRFCQPVMSWGPGFLEAQMNTNFISCHVNLDHPMTGTMGGWQLDICGIFFLNNCALMRQWRHSYGLCKNNKIKTRKWMKTFKHWADEMMVLHSIWLHLVRKNVQQPKNVSCDLEATIPSMGHSEKFDKNLAKSSDF